MKRLIVVAMVLMAGVAVAQEAPEHGVYDASATQWVQRGGELQATGRIVSFMVGYDDNEIVMRWDYDGDGEVADEATEVYPVRLLDDGIVWTDDDGGYLMWQDTHGTFVIIEFHSGELIAVRLDRMEEW
jgi:hypothetical protein